MKFGWLIKVLQNLNPPRVGELRILIRDGDSHVSATLRLVRELAIFICLSGASDGCPWRNLLHRSICSIPFHAVNLRCPGSALFTGFHLFDFFFTPKTSFQRPHSFIKRGGRCRPGGRTWRYLLTWVSACIRLRRKKIGVFTPFQL